MRLVVHTGTSNGREKMVGVEAPQRVTVAPDSRDVAAPGGWPPAGTARTDVALDNLRRSRDDRLMNAEANARLSLVLRMIGALFVLFFVVAFVASAMKVSTPDILYRMLGWGDVGDAEEQMISIVYIVWGVFLWLAARDPVRNRLFIDFTLMANVAHFGLMGIQSFTYDEHTHLYGDVLLGFVVLGVLAAAWLPVRRQLVTQS